MNAEITVKIEGQEVAAIQQEFTLTKAIAFETPSERLEDRVGKVVLEPSSEHLEQESAPP